MQKIEDDVDEVDLAILKLKNHALVWWEAYVDSLKANDELLVKRWITFKEFLQS